MEITKLSTKGQIVIPESARKNLEVGTAFTVVRKGDLIILKEIFDLAVEKNDAKFLVYGFNRKLTLDQQILFKETLKRYKDGRR